MLVNNETGAINPIKECAAYVHAYSRAVFHMDGVQGLGKIPISLHDVIWQPSQLIKFMV